MAEQCAFCGNKHLHAKTTRYIHQENDELLIVDEVPCTECDFCGEQYFDVTVLKSIEAEHLAILRHQKVPRQVRPVAMETFAELSA
ncbi:MAG TPA: YgiT-type zinc finger protein [Methylococcaceae bacterium]|nr:YgiT-type zinc finger protein [Methylococcaceae bacterium]